MCQRNFYHKIWGEVVMIIKERYRYVFDISYHERHLFYYLMAIKYPRWLAQSVGCAVSLA